MKSLQKLFPIFGILREFVFVFFLHKNFFKRASCDYVLIRGRALFFDKSYQRSSSRIVCFPDKFDSLAERDGIRASAFEAFVLQRASHVDRLQIYVRLPPQFLAPRREFVRFSLSPSFSLSIFLVNKKIYIFVSASSSGSYYMEYSTSI